MKKLKIRKLSKHIVVHILVILLLIWTLGPIAWMIISSMTPGIELMTLTGPLIPATLSFDRYTAIIIGGEVMLHGRMVRGPGELFMTALRNSFVVTASVTALSLAIGGLAAYAFARLRFLGNRSLLFLALFFQLMPPIAMLVPYYFMVRTLGMVNQLSTLVVVYISFVLVYVIWVMTSYFKTIPIELEEAALIDGCTRIGALIRILLPTAAPGFVAVGALSFLMSWDEFLYALIFMTTNQTKTLPVIISEFTTQFGVDYGMMMTGGVIATVPPLILALFFQKYIVSGLASGAVKG